MTKILHGLPEKVTFCKRCVMSNQRPSTTPEHTKSSTDIKTAEFDENGVCHACLFSDFKKKINWNEREKQFEELLAKYRTKNSSYDTICDSDGNVIGVNKQNWRLFEYNYNMTLFEERYNVLSFVGGNCGLLYAR